MTTIQIEVQDDLVQRLGVAAVQKLLEEELAYQRFKLLEESIQASMQAAEGVDWEKEFEQARQEAFDDYQRQQREK
ncbi:hypothetical protein GCM10023189_15800 [Nibrella saemangeumensis]|uniref:Uncharacterized protein n=1 Tax=Nibrella saemangeumensis TaxID=1084526 RepID=A0ABP8MNP9_9BACT